MMGTASRAVINCLKLKASSFYREYCLVFIKSGHLGSSSALPLPRLCSVVGTRSREIPHVSCS